MEADVSATRKGKCPQPTDINVAEFDFDSFELIRRIQQF